MITLYGHEMSGNSYKVRLFLELLHLDYEWIKVDLMKGEQKSPDYLALNPFGQVPVLIDDTIKLTDAQAILVYLARQYGGEQWLPVDALPLAQVIRWLSTTAGEVRQGPENARLYHLFGATSINIERAQQKADYILTQLDRHLSTRTWLEFERPTIADVAVFPYVALAQDGKIDLNAYPQVLTWIDRVKHLPGFIGMAGIGELVAA
ncbi:MAG: glutathione S-transferase [Leptolyngbyaceae cyanobacterium SL_7_1]|nr:glutathione S-transferase [Leptolyngbyaceae cyanobacterium SL_7_1]